MIALVSSRGHPPKAPLVWLSALARDRSTAEEPLSPSEAELKQQAKRVLEVSIGALNTLQALEAFGNGERGEWQASLGRERAAGLRQLYRSAMVESARIPASPANTCYSTQALAHNPITDP